MAEIHTPYSSLKKLLSLLNGFVAVSGIILVSLGIGGKYGGASLTNVLGLSSAYLLHTGNLCLVMGCIAVLLGCAGWYGATKESRGMLLFCILSMVIVLIMEVTAATVVLLFFPILKCCGVNNYTDFSGSSFEMTTGHTYPRGCCKSIGTVACDGRNVSTNVIHQKRRGLSMLPRLVSNSWPQAILLPQPLKLLGLQHEPPHPAWAVSINS
nr:tetraspanin-16 isoform X8 [Pongo abelii]